MLLLLSGGEETPVEVVVPPAPSRLRRFNPLPRPVEDEDDIAVIAAVLRHHLRL